MARWLARQIGRVDIVICSTQPEAIVTGETMAKALGSYTATTRLLDPDGTVKGAWQEIYRLAQQSADVLVIGGETVSDLIDMHGGVDRGGVAKADGNLFLVWLVTPALIAKDEDTAEIVEAARALGEALKPVRVTEAQKAKRSTKLREAADAGATEKSWVGGTCDVCQENGDAGWIDMDDQFPSGDDEPPAHPNCVLADTFVLATGITAQFRRWYEGSIYILRFGDAPELSVTPNHPILTRRGWVAASGLQVGDDVIQRVSPTAPFPSPLGHPHDDYMESSIENVADTLLLAGGVRSCGVPTAPEAFHGDSSYNKVDVVYAAGSLPINASQSSENSVNLGLAGGHRLRRTLASLSPLKFLFQRVDTTPNGGVSGCGARGTFYRGISGGAHNAGGAQAALNKPSEIPVLHNSLSGDSDTPRDIEDAFPFQMRVVKLTNIKISTFHGFVYNLSTRSGFFFANSILVHNCDCEIETRDADGEPAEDYLYPSDMVE
jgi:hypothetical protein